MMESAPLNILLLDGRILTLPYNNYPAVDLLLSVTELLNIHNSMYANCFGFTFIDYCDRICWLHMDKGLYQQHIKPSQDNHIRLVFRLRFYPVKSLKSIDDHYFLLQMFLDARRNLHKGGILCDGDIAVYLIVLMLITEYGHQLRKEDFVSYFHSLTLKNSWIPTQVMSSRRSVERIIEKYSALVQLLSRGDALYRFLEVLNEVPYYGTQFYDVMDGNDSLWVGLHSSGILVFPISDRCSPLKHYPWCSVLNAYSRNSRLSIELQSFPSSFSPTKSNMHNMSHSHSSPLFQSNEMSVVVWYISSERKAKIILDEILAHLTHYTCTPERMSERFRKVEVGHQQMGKRLNSLLQEGSQNDKSPTLCVPLSSNKQLRLPVNIEISVIPYGDISSLNPQFHEVFHPPMNAIHNMANTFGIPLPISSNNQVNDDRFHHHSLEHISYEQFLRQQRDKLTSLLKAKEDELRQLCLDEAAITGEFPHDYQPKMGEKALSIRRCLLTKYKLSSGFTRDGDSQESLINGTHTSDLTESESTIEQELQQLELEHELQTQILRANQKLANDSRSGKKIQKGRQRDVVNSLDKLYSLECRLYQLQIGCSRNVSIDSSYAQSSVNGEDVLFPFKSTPSTSSMRELSTKLDKNAAIHSAPPCSTPKSTEEWLKNDNIICRFHQQQGQSSGRKTFNDCLNSPSLTQSFSTSHVDHSLIDNVSSNAHRPTDRKSSLNLLESRSRNGNQENIQKSIQFGNQLQRTGPQIITKSVPKSHGNCHSVTEQGLWKKTLVSPSSLRYKSDKSESETPISVLGTMRGNLESS